MGIESDLLYPLHQQKELHALIPGSAFEVVRQRILLYYV
jgi:homoserine acetyltransferase